MTPTVRYEIVPHGISEMSWVKVDDAMPRHPKISAVSLQARWLLITCWCYAADWLTDGRLSAVDVAECGKAVRHPTRCYTELLTVGLLERGRDGDTTLDGDRVVYRIHNYLKYNPTRATELARKAATRDRVRDWRGRHPRTLSNDVTNGVTNDVTNITPVPVPVPDREDVLTRTSSPARELCHLLIKLLEDDGAKTPSEVPQSWLDAAMELIETEHREPAEVAALLRWATADQFWKANVLTMPQFQKHYDTIRLQSQRNPWTKPGDAQWRADQFGKAAAAIRAVESTKAPSQQKALSPCGRHGADRTCELCRQLEAGPP